MDYHEWVFITDGRAIVIEALSLESATKHYVNKYSNSGKPLHIVEISGHSSAKKPLFKRSG
jgi:Mg-chelatase subunit ChlD